MPDRSEQRDNTRPLDDHQERRYSCSAFQHDVFSQIQRRASAGVARQMPLLFHSQSLQHSQVSLGHGRCGGQCSMVPSILYLATSCHSAVDSTGVFRSTAAPLSSQADQFIYDIEWRKPSFRAYGLAAFMTKNRKRSRVGFSISSGWVTSCTDGIFHHALPTSQTKY